ncbi:MAG TPA: cyclase family protein [Candidatus Binatia bacterium]|nr:cyclase family protein [Candidatus Binatia bacterium]
MKNQSLPAMTVTDLSHTLEPGMPYFPGTEATVFSRPFTVASHGFAEQRISMLTHSGTHMDAPAHILENGATLEQLGLPHFVGSALIIDRSASSRPVIDVDELLPFRGFLEGKDFVLLRTGWCDHWGEAAYFRDFPVLSEAAALWLAAFRFKGIGVDTISFDAHDSSALPIHRIFLGLNIVLVENLVNLERIPEPEFIFCCLPLKIAAADGAPVRAVALCPKKNHPNG